MRPQPDAKVVMYDAQHDNLATITSKLQDLVNTTGQKIDDLAIVGHGSDGLLNLGADQIQFFNLGNYKATFEALGQTLAQDAQIQFYGCSLAGDASGQAMVNSIATFTAATVFASTDTTGGNAHDWTLEYSSNSSVAMDSVLNTDALAADNTPLAAPVLVKDIDTSPTSYPAGYTVMNGKVYFSAADGISSTDSYGEPWVYDPVTGTTTLLKDIRPLYSSQPQYFTASGGKLFFNAYTESAGGAELWVSNGIPDGTVGADTHMVKDSVLGINPTGASAPSSLVDVGGKLYFLANDGSGTTLWSTDGTDPNTIEFTGANNPLNVSSIANLTNVNGKLYFTGTSATYGQEVYTVNNTTGNIELAANIHATAGSSPTSLTAVGSTLYLVANDGGGVAVHQIVGTTDTEIANSLSITAFSNLTNVNGTLFFAGTTAASGQELYKVAGGAEVLVKNINPNGTSGGNPANLTAVGSTVYFTANDGTGLALWQSDGTDPGTTKVNNLTGSDAVTSFANLKNIGGKLFFSGTSTSTGSELYKVEGGSIVLAQDIYAGASGSGPASLTDIGGGKLIFTANNGYTGNEPWVVDGTNPGLNPATTLDINHGGGNAQFLTNLNGTLYFAASDGGHGLELWKSDGTRRRHHHGCGS